MTEPAPSLSLRSFGVLSLAVAVPLAVDLFWIERQLQPLAHAGLLLLASLPWLWLCFLLLARRRRIPLSWVLLAGVLLRVMMQLASPALSDDLYRYVWEGRMQLAGHNPFLHAPEDPLVAQPGDEIWEGINNKPIPAAYPPVCQLWLRVLAWGPQTLEFARSGFALTELLLLFLLAVWLAQLGRDPSLCLVLALCPVALIEWSAEGHNDALAAMLLLAALTCLGRLPERGDERLPWWRMLSGGGLLGAAIGAKFLPVLLLPWLLRRDWRILLPALCVLLASYVPFWPGLERVGELFDGVTEFGARWRHNDSLFVLIYEGTRSFQDWAATALPESWLSVSWLDGLVHGETQRVSKLPLALLLGFFALYVFVKEKEPGAAAIPLFTVLFALSPVLHPWYVVWCVPFLALRPRPALFVLLALVSLSHHTLGRWHREGVWQEEAIWKWVQYAPFYATILATVVGRFIRRR
jgi:hypothetical protein